MIDKDLYPFESHWLDLDGVRYHYLDEGPRDAPPVLMLHGNPTWSFYYRTLIPAISERYRVVVPDHVGCGLSDKPQDYTYTLAQHGENVTALVEALGLKDITLVVHDWGGFIGMYYATRNPGNVARLVIFDTAAFYLDKLPWVIKLARSPVIGDLLVRGLNAFAGLALPLAIKRRERRTPAVRAGYLAPYDSWANRIAILRFVQDIPFEQGHVSLQTVMDIDRTLSLLAEHPMLIIWGAQDFVFTVEHFLAEWQSRFPYAETHVVEDAGHYVVEDAHERIVPWVLAFLER